MMGAGAFSELIRPAAVSLDTLDVEGLWDASRPTGVKVKLPLILDLVRLAHRQPIDVRPRLAFVRSVNGRRSPPLVDESQGELVRLLATATLIRAFQQSSEQAAVTAAALAVVACSRPAWQPSHPALYEAAQAYIAANSVKSRIPADPPSAGVNLGGEFNVLVTRQTQQDPPTSYQALSPAQVSSALDKTRGGVESVSAALTETHQWVIRRELQSQEQLAFAWWLMSASTEDMGVPLAIATAAEVVPLIRFPLAPHSLDELLKKRLGHEIFASIIRPPTDTDSLNVDVRQRLARLAAVPQHIEDLCPVHNDLAAGRLPSVRDELTVGELTRRLIVEQLLGRAATPAGAAS
jgi:hypothetical protein